MRFGRPPVLVGTTSVDVSELLSRMLDLRHIGHQVLNAKLHQKEAHIVALAGQSNKGTVYLASDGTPFTTKAEATQYMKQNSLNGDVTTEERLLGAVTIATNMAGRGTDIKLSDTVKEAGGLAIIGTERHESRRVSTVSSVVVPVVRVTPVRLYSLFRSKTTLCVCLLRNALLASWTNSALRKAKSIQAKMINKQHRTCTA